MKALGRNISGLGRSMLPVSIAALAIGGAVTKAAVDWDDAFAGVEKTVDGTTEQLNDLEKQLLNIAKVTPVSHETIAKIGELAGQLGVPIRDISRFTDTIAKLTVTTNLTAEMAATRLAQFLNITRSVAPAEADMAEQTARVGATIVELGNNLATTEVGIVDFADRVAGAGAAVGMSQEDILGWSAALSSMGLRAQMGGTAISRVFVEVASSVSKAAGTSEEWGAKQLKTQHQIEELTGKIAQQESVLQRHREELVLQIGYWGENDLRVRKHREQIEGLSLSLDRNKNRLEELSLTMTDKMGGSLEAIAKLAGVTEEEFADLFAKDASEAMLLFVEGLGKVRDEGGDVLAVLEELGYTDIRTRDALLRASGNVDLLRGSLEMASEAYEKQNALEAEAAKRFKTTASQLKLLMNNLKNMATIVGNVLLPIINDLVARIVPLIQRFTDWAELHPGIIKIGAAFLAVVAAAAPLLMILGGLITAVGTLLSPIGLVIA
ncbi:MAG: phage tail tape measure protein, partial [Gammaproteobacteria bacterium]|nr:phage tail tape measure protein [Gammaproteobacteria bacterium]